MKRLLIYMIIVIILFFLIPIIFTSRFEKIEQVIANKNYGEGIVDGSYDYGKYEKIKLLHSDTGKIESVNIDEYLYNVVSAEMPVDYEIEALKAQATVARTYTLYKIINSSKHKNADICDDSGCCQAWISKDERYKAWKTDKDKKWEKIKEAVDSTKGKIITYKGKVINAFFHSNSGGKTERPLYVWGGEGYPYLQSVETSGEDTYKQYSSEVLLKKDEFTEKMKKEYKDFKIDFNDKDCIKIISYTEGDRIKQIKIGNKTLSGVEVRKIFELRSANFSIDIGKNNIKFIVKGYGHGVGLSQTGSNTLAKQGKNYIEIIKHFYSGVDVQNANY